NVFASVDDYVLAGVPYTCFFTEVGHAFHGTYWHEDFGTPKSHGCVNMRTNEAQWLFRWARPPHNVDSLSKNYYFRGYGTTVDIHY
ncbi:MAG: L,D-transpeptidase, partial [Chloroflexi bacterium]|nr:L,D-transpeptidase [Chloroflexota bacterium]